LQEARSNLRGPRRFGVRVHFVVEALDQLTGERGTLLVGKLKGLSK
jgi:hypothetical protein